MNYDTLKYAILKYLDTQQNFVFAGHISREVHATTNAKESILERRMRELFNDGKLERDYRQVRARGRGRCVCYKIKLPSAPKDLYTHYKDMGRVKIEFVEVNGERRAKEIII